MEDFSHELLYGQTGVIVAMTFLHAVKTEKECSWTAQEI
jgi:hypothetical protein